MRKSITKRIRITRTGKIMKRKMAQGHFRAGKTGKAIRNKRGPRQVHKSDSKSLKSYMTRMGGAQR
ncbi:MAG: hypothetical protein A3B23_00735 [Candidatus Colwellbacteria bacterium RIFCSPLOWO2_01_FULL_48_10]|uniref:50S ribosomal protein L35 n=2 Tax=Bacteria candidate phyla TaxID=1783234 RepID=A0A1F5NYZ2_9BACT|nr:MAG: hypothetical protein A2846_03375 [Candidatus Doudnabacteria bacterium RIFCSPHIGHO2_01_FULL_49_9]OGY59711.1 MAG: hypothetical protein A3B23_00735 [Candidatus Colwellbacteria bacterium RIFCSPLOWO2_01_FULL_48_10]